jgi:glucose/mannose transport system permease protein
MKIRHRPAPASTSQKQSLVVTMSLIVAALFFLMPVYVMVVNGLKDASNVSVSEMWSPSANLSGGGFTEAMSRLAPSLRNSFMVTVPATILSCVIGSINGYLFAKWRFRGSRFLFVMLIFGMFIPFQSVLLPLIRTLQAFDLYGTIPGLIVVHSIYGIAITTLIFRNYYVALPTDLIDAARVDGCGVVSTFLRVVLPLSIPGFVVAGIFQFTGIWNDFLFALTVTPDPRVQPVMVALNNLSGSFSVDWNVVMAGAFIAAIPTALVYLVLSRYFVQGLTAGSIKG